MLDASAFPAFQAESLPPPAPARSVGSSIYVRLQQVSPSSHVMEMLELPANHTLAAYQWPTLKDQKGYADCVALNMGDFGDTDVAVWTGARGEYYARWRYLDAGQLEPLPRQSTPVGTTQGYSTTHDTYAYLLSDGSFHASSDWMTPPPAPLTYMSAIGAQNLKSQANAFFWNGEVGGRVDCWSPDGHQTLVDTDADVGSHAESSATIVWTRQPKASRSSGTTYDHTEIWWSPFTTRSSGMAPHHAADIPANVYQANLVTWGDRVALLASVMLDSSAIPSSKVYVVDVRTGDTVSFGQRTPSSQWRAVLGIGEQHLLLAEGDSAAPATTFQRIVIIELSSLSSVARSFRN